MNHVITLVGWKTVTLETEASLFCSHICAEMEVSRQKLSLWRVHLTLASAYPPRNATDTQTHRHTPFSCFLTVPQGVGRRLCCPFSPCCWKTKTCILHQRLQVFFLSFLAFSWQLFCFLSGSGLLYCLPALTHWVGWKAADEQNKYLFIYCQHTNSDRRWHGVSSFVEHGSKFLCPESFLCKVAGNRIIKLIWGLNHKKLLEGCLILE